MHLKLSKTVLVFAAIGFVIALTYMTADEIYTRAGNPALDRILSSDIAVLLCPPSFSLMAMDAYEPPTWFDIAFAFVFIVAMNTVWYGFIGFVLSKLWGLLRHAAPSAGRG